MIEKAIVKLLSDDLKVSSLVSSSAGPKIYMGIKPQDEPGAAIILHSLDASEDPPIYGASSHSKGTLQIDCWDDSYLASAQLADAIRSVLNGFSGTVQTGDEPTIVDSILIDGRSTSYDPPPEGSGLPIMFCTTIDVSFIEVFA